MVPRPRTYGALRALVALCGALPLVPACGGRSDTEEYLFGDEPIAVGATSNAGGSGAAGRGVGGSAPVGGTLGIGASAAIGGTPGEAGMPSVGGTGAAGSGQGGVATAGTTGTAGTPGTAGAAGAGSGSPISCGAEVCDASTERCCAGFGGFQCVPLGGACQGAVLACTNNADCGAEVCCISITGDASAASSCRPRCDTMGGGRDRQLCQVDDDCRPPFRFCTPTVFGVNICTRRP